MNIAILTVCPSLKCNVEQLGLIQPLGIIKSSSNIKPNRAACHCPSCLPIHVGAHVTVDQSCPLFRHQHSHSNPPLIYPLTIL